jgi:hypothetical protein
MLVMVQGTMPRNRRTRLQPVADGVDKLLFESDPPEALVASSRAGWVCALSFGAGRPGTKRTTAQSDGRVLATGQPRCPPDLLVTQPKFPSRDAM